MKYGEDKIVKEIDEYIKSTYGQHYSTTEDGFQVQDMLRQLDIDKDFCQANAIKYLCRYGKKDGKNRKDLLKAIHYIVLLMSSEDKTSAVSWAEHEEHENRLEQMATLAKLDPVSSE
tara:strand:- start:1644 stop:1994 length:351 start_codon:yes stop_codon:yes gene_type:complete